LNNVDVIASQEHAPGFTGQFHRSNRWSDATHSIPVNGAAQRTRSRRNCSGTGEKVLIPNVRRNLLGRIFVAENKSGFGGKEHNMKNRFMVAASGPDFLQQIAEIVRIDPEIELLDVKGPAADPRAMLVNMTNARAEQLKKQFGADILVEPDAPLELF
jgi:hypothetical protein